MEAAREQGSTGLLNKILPPRLEDAGLEDCALPPGSIHEAFLKAANAVKSRAASFFDSDDDEIQQNGVCVTDPSPAAKDNGTLVGGTVPNPGASDTVVGGFPGADTEGPCLGGKGDGPGVRDGGDAVVVGGESIGKELEGEKCCVGDGLEGLGTEGKVNDETEEEGERKKPNLLEGFV
ncbi:uncharacterized protein LOC110810838 [Carica papaya]|uniref:uncharacterized protein LOC110810838 n=1 Tax=Carica papaya TaxID=3649 RepID=UPI000B8CBB03|nr:uncharacterized protein LOC110810838 [Carica papaya]